MVISSVRNVRRKFFLGQEIISGCGYTQACGTETATVTRSNKFAKEQKRKRIYIVLKQGERVRLFASIFDTIDKVWKGGL